MMRSSGRVKLQRVLWLLPVIVATLLSPRSVMAVGVNQDEEIIYIDPAGVIRVFDPVQSADNAPVQWVSPTGGWLSFALGDFTGDGSQEIVAVGHGDMMGALSIFDPVYVGSDPVPGQQINGINWVTHFQTQFPTVPSYVATGRFEDGDELAQIVVSRPLVAEERTDPTHLHRLQIWRAAGTPPSPTAWNVIATFDSAYTWDWIATGDYTGNGLDEIAVIDRTRGHLGVFRLGANRTLERLYANESDIRPWQTVEFGQYTTSPTEEMVAVRLSSSLNNLWAFRWANNQTTDLFTAFFLPPPRFAFLADLGGNGDMEIVALREVPSNINDRPRLFVRDNGNDPIALREALLEPDNGFMAGAGGDLNGDGRDAIILIRDNRIRVYYEPYRNRDFVDYPLPTNTRTVHIGNLDATGQRPIPRLEVVPGSFTVTMIQGEKLATLNAQVVSQNVNEPLTFFAASQAAQAWLSVSPATGVTPESITLAIDATNLSPGSYPGQVTVSTQSAGLHQSVDVNVTLNVLAGIRLSPEQVTIPYAPCTEDAPAQVITFGVTGATGTQFSTELYPEAPWIQVAPAQGTVPSQVTVTLEPGLLVNDGAAEATLILRSFNSTVPAFTPEATIRLVCQDQLLYMPIVGQADNQ